MLGLVEELQANYEAIIRSEKLSTARKNHLLSNILTDVEHIFWEMEDDEYSLFENQQKAGNLLENIKRSMTLNS
ncbi:hypothetical protein JTF06_07870 [Desemzia sp. RIT804]|uniref:hypothetical protein n=1 Tax=Desemzia sp. RIT 804 TaxID=2810209 RepID=UPI00194FA537|nr:hypothetical protein [Desemzia sp. RIT 804]MBM6614806.1 hypothetical protein [Desemzia sp. RIT 804]